MTRRLLVTTALEQTWGCDQRILFAGEWCRLYDRRDVWSRREHDVLPYHWSDRAKLQRDHAYLDELQESLLLHLTEALNVYHDIDRPLRYWRMVLGVWLPTYVAVVFDRWECLRSAFGHEREMETIALPLSARQDPPRDSDTFINAAAYSAVWNHALFMRIIKYAHADRCNITPLDRGESSEADTAITLLGASGASRAGAKGVLKTLVEKLDTLAGTVFRSYKVILVNSYFSHGALIKLNAALGQVPRLHCHEFTYDAEAAASAYDPARPIREQGLRISRPAASDFEVFLTSQIAANLPRTCVEEFGVLRERVRRIGISTKVICSAGAHWSNDVFKLWCAEQMLGGVKFVALTHGGAVPCRVDQTMWYEERVSDKKVTWTIPYLPNHVRLPPSKLAGKRIHSSKTICSVITQETPLHPFRASSGPIGVDVLEIVPLVCNLYAALRPEIQERFRIKPYRNCGWNTRKRFVDALGAERIFAGQSYDRCLAQSRLVVCTYPETTFAEAMASGLPTLLVYPAHLWEIIPEMEALLAALRASGIVYEDPQRAADHINSIWADPDGWWSGVEVRASRQQFFDDCLDLDEHWVQRWTTFLRETAA